VNAARARVAALLVGIALGVLGIVIPLTVRPRAVRYIPLDLPLGWSFLFAGALAWWRRPDNRTGLIMMATGVVWFGHSFDWLRDPLGSFLNSLAVSLTLALVAHQFIVFPRGRARSRLEPILIGSIYVLAVAGSVLPRLFYDPRLEGCFSYGCRPSLLLVYANHAGYIGATRLVALLAVVAVVAVVALLIWRWMQATPPARLALTPVLCVAPVVAAVVAGNLWQNGLAVTSLFSFGNYALQQWSTIVYTLLPLAFLAGLLRTRLHRTALGSLVVELSEAPPPEEVEAALARAVGDPSLQIAYRAAEPDTYIDAAGQPFELPSDRPDREVTVLKQGREPLAALIYDSALLEDRAFVQAAAAVARLALENARLQAALRAQLAAVRASRARIVEAGDAERRRLERDLHDGAQQRLLGILLALRLARDYASDSGQLEELLAEAEAELHGTLDELRALARGIHPAVLTEEGLAPALETLARRSSVPVHIQVVPSGRMPVQVEAAAYFVVSEALANATKHAHASQVALAVQHQNGAILVDISDNGVGGADAAGHGLTGLRDRVEALDGQLLVESSPGRGTRIHAEIPCG
jgi:signal transduction histidine kinase